MRRLILTAFLLMPLLCGQSEDRVWLSGQANWIEQFHGPFRSPYQGPNSLLPAREHALSRILTLYTGVQLTDSLEFLFDVEAAGGGGISSALGVAGFTNLDVVRNPTLGQAPYIARAMLHKTFALSDETVESSRNPLNLASTKPVRRIELRLGKMSTADFFDLNSIGSDSHLQFMNWTADNNGSYDYAADTRGYTYGAVVEYYDRNWAVRFGEMLMPKVANGVHLDADLARAHAENFELEWNRKFLPRRHGTVRPLLFINHANMGSYRDAIAAFRAGIDASPDITLHRKQGRVKHGIGLNMEQELTPTLHAYARLGWNEGHQESFAYTEVDHGGAAGIDLRGNRWHRADDKFGGTLIVNGISAEHSEYLRLGGLGFLLGDGGLRYGRETIFETYYTFHVWRGVSLSADLQRVWNPGYNRDRGPVLVPAFRLHVEEAAKFGRHPAGQSK